MKLIPMGDYYVWYCEWCDSRNLTLWTRIESGKTVCGACHRGALMQDVGYSPDEQALSSIL